MLFTLNDALVADVAEAYTTGGLGSISGVLNISDIRNFFRQDKSSSVSHIIKDNSRDL